jgi:hypothetical protein
LNELPTTDTISSQAQVVLLKRWTKRINGATFCLAFWTVFWPQPYPLAIYACCLMPWLALAAVLTSKNMIGLDVNANSDYPDVGASFLTPGVALALRAFLDFQILSWQNFWPLFAALSLVLFLCVLHVEGGIRKLKANTAIILFFCATYAYASLICLNAVTDRSTRTVYQAHVLDKRISKGKHDDYYLLLSPWGNRANAREIDVEKRVYARHNKGETANVVVRKGRFKIPWYYVE